MLDKVEEDEEEKERARGRRTKRMFRKTFGPRFLEVRPAQEDSDSGSIDVIYVKCL